MNLLPLDCILRHLRDVYVPNHIALRDDNNKCARTLDCRIRARVGGAGV